MGIPAIQPDHHAGQPRVWHQWQRDVIGARPPTEPAPATETKHFAEAYRDTLATMLRWAAEGKHYDEVRDQAEQLFAELRRSRPEQQAQTGGREPER